jgi:hypothetical protein
VVGIRALLGAHPKVSVDKPRNGRKDVMDKSEKLAPEVTTRLRALAHDLSNSIETILQACYLLGQANLEANAKKWVALIDNAAQDAARINRSIREILRSQS